VRQPRGRVVLHATGHVETAALGCLADEAPQGVVFRDQNLAPLRAAGQPRAAVPTWSALVGGSTLSRIAAAVHPGQEWADLR
jgi:hypothetical protein